MSEAVGAVIATQDRVPFAARMEAGGWVGNSWPIGALGDAGQHVGEEPEGARLPHSWIADD